PSKHTGISNFLHDLAESVPTYAKYPDPPATTWGGAGRNLYHHASGMLDSMLTFPFRAASGWLDYPNRTEGADYKPSEVLMPAVPVAGAAIARRMPPRPSPDVAKAAKLERAYPGERSALEPGASIPGVEQAKPKAPLPEEPVESFATLEKKLS